MATLNMDPFMQLTLQVDFKNVVRIGQTSSGFRSIAPVVGGKFESEDLNGIVLNGNDWVLTHIDGMDIDVRIVLKTDDDALIYCSYLGRFLASPEAMQKFASGQLLDESEYSLTIYPTFETGSEKYQWLNDLQLVGKGVQTLNGPIYSIYKIA